MNPLFGLLISGHTLDSYPFAAGLLGPVSHQRELNEISEIFNDIEIGDSVDQLEIDMKCAQFVREKCSSAVYACALSVHIPGTVHSCGGIIGSPCARPSSASLRPWSENIGHGLSLAAVPGQGGVVVCGNPLFAEACIHFAGAEKGGAEFIDRVLGYAGEKKIIHALAVHDGTGCGMRGGVGLLCDGRKERLLIPGLT
ncbi:MAG: hypothetical protein GF401_15205 [Chitinivibrionales bacterium]|nr:hypothetical protein [Chitinivibrionales bacterium]